MDESIKLLPDTSVPKALFIPHPFLVNTFKAHPDTIRAVKKELFFSDQLQDIPASLSPCPQCSQILEKAFWLHCPFCGEIFT